MSEKRESAIVDLNEGFWTDKYQNDQIGWDIGYVSSPLKAYFDQLEDKGLKILIPGAGNAYEAEYLWANGFKNIHIVDISLAPLTAFKKRIPDFPNEQLIHADFFQLSDKFDLIIEQTFFCALNPSLRRDYVLKMRELLKSNGQLVGLMFKVPLFEDRPPFGGNEIEYRDLFSDCFRIDIMEVAYNSISPRQGSELFVKMVPSEL
ncbi:methyltransferase domain-containing protein [Roseivirga sp. E12]|uniref:methyltransferase domain-containing protein n=1 Tax=Roseivirga sp. E12 TaxID=2819237 RepID=UPI001ABC79BE|nr:methyltransferase domain-containing protein [Roseivirga sp. E12]MBO3698344.1 SAM-dependent methyltransferase [Roseivirga sp. E12]